MVFFHTFILPNYVIFTCKARLTTCFFYIMRPLSFFHRRFLKQLLILLKKTGGGVKAEKNDYRGLSRQKKGLIYEDKPRRSKYAISCSLLRCRQQKYCVICHQSQKSWLRKSEHYLSLQPQHLMHRK